MDTDAGTRIWLDRTAQGRSDVGATLADRREGRTVEAGLAHDGRGAEWIRIRALPER